MLPQATCLQSASALPPRAPLRLCVRHSALRATNQPRRASTLPLRPSSRPHARKTCRQPSTTRRAPPTPSRTRRSTPARARAAIARAPRLITRAPRLITRAPRLIIQLINTQNLMSPCPLFRATLTHGARRRLVPRARTQRLHAMRKLANELGAPYGGGVEHRPTVPPPRLSPDTTHNPFTTPPQATPKGQRIPGVGRPPQHWVWVRRKTTPGPPPNFPNRGGSSPTSAGRAEGNPSHGLLFQLGSAH